ncbi:MAG: MgtC/SapB family protein [Opitutales bacterium]
MDAQTQLFILAKVAVAALFAGVIGAEREMARKPAGFRTHMLLASAAALLVSVAAAFIEETASATTGATLRPDPLRIVEAIVAGVAFLGAGTIIRSRGGNEVEGLTTAGSLLLVAAIGVTVALELYLLAGLVTVLSLLILRLLHVLDRFFDRRAERHAAKHAGPGAEN